MLQAKLSSVAQELNQLKASGTLSMLSSSQLATHNSGFRSAAIAANEG